MHKAKTAKAHLKGKSKPQLAALIMYLLTLLRFGNPKAYRSAERRIFGKHGSKAAKKHRGRRPPKGKVPPQLRPYLFKKGHRKVRKRRRR